MFETHIIDIYKGGICDCKIFLETSTFLVINGIVSLLEASYELGPLSSLPLVSP